ncbi:MFS transporter [Sphingomonas sanguinis]|uniref:Permease n=1 Tax=Sphingomonas sanguinis TaxID=33051 RepID=A0A147ISN8_9SPHN|nr:MFS transporter [Sphingomonas sanguinis]KTT98214.1 permease [Sphingomonas sanguinis]
MTDTTVQTSRRTAWLGFVTVLALVLLVAMDGSVLYLAMPHITAAIRPTPDESLWILDVYGFVVGSLLITFGNIGDCYGRLKLVIAGAILFGLGSLGAAFSSTPTMLIACRALMGFGGATLLPSGLAIVSALFSDPRERAQAIGIFAATFAAGFAIGPVVGGLLLQYFDWGVVFLINVPIVIGFLIGAPAFLSDVRTANTGRIDAPSLVLSFAGILMFIWSVKAAAAYGIDIRQMVVGGIGLAALVLFIHRQRRIDDPLLDLSLFRDRVFSIAILTGLLSLVVWSATGYLSGVYLQSVLGHQVLIAALLTLPGAIVLTGTCVLTSRIVERIGRKAALVAIHLLIGAGVLLLLMTDMADGATAIIASTIVAGVGYGLSFSLVAEVAVSAVPAERAGAAGSIAETSNELGNALGISLLGSVAAICFRLFGPGVAGTLGETLQRPGLSQEMALQAKQAFLTGLHAAAGIAGAITLLVGIFAWLWLPRRLPE